MFMKSEVENRSYGMRRYVVRGFEDRVINVLKSDNACIFGLAGMGKTTTARYIYVKLKREGKKVIYLTREEIDIEFRDENGKKEEIRSISLREVWRGDRKDDEVEILAYAVVIALNGTLLHRLGKKGWGSLKWIVEKFGSKKLEKLEDLHTKICIGISEVKEVAEKLYDWFEDSFGIEVVNTFGKNEIIGKMLEFFRKNILNDSLLSILLNLSAFLILGLTVSSTINNIKELIKELLEKNPLSKIDEDMVFIVDDLADFDEDEIKNLVRFLKVVNERGVKILFVKRIDDTDEECLETYFKLLRFMYDTKKRVPDLNKLLFRGAKDFLKIRIREKLFFMDSADKEKFVELLNANGYTAEVIENKFKIKFNEALDTIYKVSAGTICIALYLLELDFTMDEMRKIGEAEMYYTFSEIVKANEDEKRLMVESNKTLKLSSLFEIYSKLKEYPCYIAIILNDLSEDEIEMFCEDERIYKRFGKCSIISSTDKYYRIIIESYKEDWKGKKRKVYRAKEMWKKFEIFLDALCEFYTDEEKEDLEKDLSIIREVIIDIFDREFEESGRFKYRMLIFALKNLEWLHLKGIKKPKSTFLWSSIALNKLPRVSLRFLPIVFEVWDERLQKENLLYALVFARTLAEFGPYIFENDGYRWISHNLNEKISDVDGDDVVLCWKIWTYSSLAKGLNEYGFFNDGYYCLMKAEEELEKMKDDNLKNLAEVLFLINKAEITRTFNPVKALYNLYQCLSNLEGLKFEDSLKEVFKPLGGKAEEKFKDQLKELRRSVYYRLGVTNYLIDLNESERFFRDCLKLSETINNKLSLLSYIGRINVIRSFEFEFEVNRGLCDFERLWNICKENLPKIPNDGVAHRCAEYLVQSILNGEFKGKEDLLRYLELDNTVKTLFYGLSYIFGCELEDLNKIVKMLRDFDLSKFPEFRDPEMAVIVGEIKIEVEEMYNCYLKGDKDYYEKYKKLIQDDEAYNSTYSLIQTLTRILFFYITGDLETAMKLAELKSKEYPKVLNKLFKDLSEVIGKELKAKSNEKDMAHEDVKKAFVKLFYFFV
ncbi:AAA ATPase [Methanocaldococcus lauensis]|uniref:AAA ATPase n=1 Tax=Methanocaldococcus lauensis TaxID=2546128 RepID=A0A8D6SW61_9EURY|nr:hypothetical protein [Methanocaldococcus lauensis]CAB3289074.1 AAA ATPase [Methanocaldococcus lauensis]